jgi:hypothetical protein
MLASTSLGGFTLFAGGLNGKVESDAVDVFDGSGKLVRTDHLSQGRGLLSAASLRDLAFFAGGQDHHGNKSDVVDILNITSGKWTATRLSKGRSMLSAASVGDVVLFAGGEMIESEGNTSKADDTSRVDIYNITSDSWSTA